MADQVVDDVQPQGQGDDTGGFYDLSAVPEDQRDIVAPHLEAAQKHWDSQAGRKFQEAAEYRQQWEPYEQLGVNQLPPQQLQELLQFNQLLQDPQATRQWWESFGQQNGWNQDPYGDPYQEPQELTPDMVAQLVAQQTAPLYAQYEAQQQAVVEQEASSQITAKLDEFEKKNGGEIDREVICSLALAHPDKGVAALDEAYRTYQGLLGKIEKETVSRKLSQPGPAEQGGRASAGGEPVTSFKDARAHALERLRSRST